MWIRLGSDQVWTHSMMTRHRLDCDRTARWNLYYDLPKHCHFWWGWKGMKHAILRSYHVLKSLSLHICPTGQHRMQLNRDSLGIPGRTDSDKKRGGSVRQKQTTHWKICYPLPQKKFPVWESSPCPDTVRQDILSDYNNTRLPLSEKIQYHVSLDVIWHWMRSEDRRVGQECLRMLRSSGAQHL